MTVLFSVLIETLWNVKKEKPSPENDPEVVLIETLWNVKVNIPDFRLMVGSVLIETLWNVKVNCTSDNVSSFFRY